MTELEQQAQQEIIKSIDASLHPQTSLNAFKQNLSAYINELINYNFEKLIHILYRIDVSEQKLKKLLAIQETNAGDVIADLIIERQLQKIKTREQFSGKNKMSDEEERW